MMRAKSEDGGGSGKIFVQSPMLMREVTTMMLMREVILMILMREAMVMMLMREAIMMMAMTDEIMMMLMRNRSNRGDADSMLRREAMMMGIMIAWLHIYHNPVRTFNFV